MKVTLMIGILLAASSLCFSFPALLPPELESLRLQGSRSLLDLDYESAKASYEQMIEQDAKHPAGYIFLANAMWQNHLSTLRRLQTSLYSKNNTFFRESNEQVDPVMDKEFQRLIKITILLSEERLEKNEADIPALYFLGMARNTLAGYEATVKRSFHSALKNGTKGVNYHRNLLKLDPTFVDAKLSIGLYKYVVGSLPFFVKVFVFFGGVTGSKKEGIKLLEEVYQKGFYSKIEAGAVLIMLYERQKRFSDALKVCDDLVIEHPNNYLFQLERANLLVNAGRIKEGRQILESLLKESKAYSYMPDLLHYRYAEALVAERDWQQAYEQYQFAAESPRAPENLITMARLGAAKSLDALKKHQEAKAEYRIVLKRKDFLDSHDQAKHYMKKPFAP